MTTGPVRAQDIRVGDILHVCGTVRMVERIVPYEGTLFGPADGVRIAHAAENWSITLIPSQQFQVSRS